MYIEAYKCTLEERLKTFARLQYDRISLALKFGQTSLWLKRVGKLPPWKFFKFSGLKPIWQAQKIIRHDRPPLALPNWIGFHSLYSWRQLVFLLQAPQKSTEFQVCDWCLYWQRNIILKNFYFRGKISPINCKRFSEGFALSSSVIFAEAVVDGISTQKWLQQTLLRW